MELTQIKGGDVGKKVLIQDGGNNIEAEDVLLKDSKLAHFAEVERTGGKAFIKPSHEEHVVSVNGVDVKSNSQSELKKGDTISFGEKKENVFAVHEKGVSISKNDVQSHIEKSGSNVSDEEFNEILRKLNLEEKIIRGLFIGLLAVSIFLTGTVFYLNSQNSLVSKKIYQSLNDRDLEIQELQKLIGENPEIECDPEIENGCEVSGEDLFEKIAILEEENKKLEEMISDNSFQKKLEEKISSLEEKIDGDKEFNFDDETKKELSLIIHSVVEEIDSFKNTDDEKAVETFDNSENLEKISSLEEKISEIQKNISGEDLDFGENGEKVGQAVKILLNKIVELQNEVRNLKK